MRSLKVEHVFQMLLVIDGIFFFFFCRYENKKMRCQKVLLFSLILALSTLINDAYRILCLFPYNGKSHFIMFEALCKGLANKGHQIDMISHFPLKKPIPNYTDIIDLNGTRKAIVSSFTIDFAKLLDRSLVYYLATDFGTSLCHLMGNEKMQKFIKNPPNDPPYDLIITEVNYWL